MFLFRSVRESAVNMSSVEEEKKHVVMGGLKLKKGGDAIKKKKRKVDLKKVVT